VSHAPEHKFAIKFFGSIIHVEKPKSEKSITKGFTEHVSNSDIGIVSFQFDKRRFESIVDCFSSSERRNL